MIKPLVEYYNRSTYYASLAPSINCLNSTFYLMKSKCLFIKCATTMEKSAHFLCLKILGGSFHSENLTDGSISLIFYNVETIKMQFFLVLIINSEKCHK